MTPLTKAQKLIRKNPSLIWCTKSYDQLELEPIAEAVFNHGTWQEFEDLKQIVGQKKLSQVFNLLDKMPRNNLQPSIRHFFRLYFKHHAHS